MTCRNSQDVGKLNGRKTNPPACDTATPIMGDENFEEPHTDEFSARPHPNEPIDLEVIYGPDAL